nr:hypothetical protein [Candidatus Sigynarchaeota archaeon]
MAETRLASWKKVFHGMLDFTARDVTYLVGGIIYLLVTGDEG